MEMEAPFDGLLKMYSVVWFCHGLIVLSYSVARCLRRQTRIQCISNCNVQISKEA